MQHPIRLAACALLLALAACDPYPTDFAEPFPPLPPAAPLDGTGPTQMPDYTGPAAPLGGFEATELEGGAMVDQVEPADCGASSRQAYVGRPASEAAGIPASGPKRVLSPGDTLGGNDPTRLTVQLGAGIGEDEGEVISRIYCG